MMAIVRKAIPWIIGAIVLIIIGAIVRGIYYYTPPTEFTMATGREGGAYHTFALEYRDRLAKLGYTLHIRPTAGSVETLQLLRKGEVDVALLQSGTEQNSEITGVVDVTGLNSLASLFYEPLWIFYRKDNANGPITDMSNLRGLRISVGEVGSGTYPIATFLMSENGVTSENSTLLDMPNMEAGELLAQGEIDASIFISSPAAETIAELLVNPDIELVTIRRGLAYQSRYSDVSLIVLAEGAVDLGRNIPDEDKELLTTVGALVAREELPADLGRLLLIVAADVHGEGGLLEDRGEFPSSKLVSIPMAPAAEKFLENGPSGLDRYFPLWIASRLEWLIFVIIPFVVLFYPLFRSTPLAVAFFFRFRIYRQYKKLRSIELGIDSYSIEEIDEQIVTLEDLQGQLTQKMRVPTMYMYDFYNLRLHIAMVINRLRAQRAILTGEEDTYTEAALEFLQEPLKAGVADNPVETEGAPQA